MAVKVGYERTQPGSDLVRLQMDRLVDLDPKVGGREVHDPAGDGEAVAELDPCLWLRHRRMDTRTAALCIIDLAPLIEAGDFRDFVPADHKVEENVAAVGTDRRRAELLYHLGDELSRYEAPEQPESDAFLQAIRAVADCDGTALMGAG